MRSAASSGRRPPARRIELTIDEYLQHVAERELHAGVVENRAAERHARSSWIRTPARSWRWPTSRRSIRTTIAIRRDRSPQPRRAGSLRAGIDVQGRDGLGGDRREGDAARRARSTRARARSASARASSTRQPHNYGVLSFTDVIVKSSNVGAIKIGFKVGTDRLSDYVQRFGFGRPVSPDFPARTRASSGTATKWTDSALASVSMGYQVGVTPLQMAAAVSSVANGGEYVEPRVVRAVVSRRPPLSGASRRSLRRTISADTAATLTASWSRSSSTAPAKLRADSGLHGRRQDRHGQQARQRPLLERARTRRLSASCRRAIRRSRFS